MNKTPLFIIRNIWWLVPLAVALLFWEHIAPILLMLVFAYLGRVILHPVVYIVEKWTGRHMWSVVIESPNKSKILAFFIRLVFLD